MRPASLRLLTALALVASVSIALPTTTTSVAEGAEGAEGADGADTAPAVVAAPDRGPDPRYPRVGRGTHLLDHEALLGDDVVDPRWYESNIGFVDLPDETIADTYYYRWRTFKEALKYTGPEDGWIVSEFLGPVGYSAPDGGISAAAGHHLYEGRWLRDPRYLDDYVDYWLRGPGAGPKPSTDALGEDTTDWAHQYSFWVADAVRARAEVDGRWDEAVDLLPDLARQYRGWSPQRDPETGLYWQTPVWDAMEYTASSYQSDDPYHGGAGYRPTLNAYQYGDARAIAALLRHRAGPGDGAAAERWDARAARLRAAQEDVLWDPEDGFYKHVMRDDNPDLVPLADREEIGFIPWYFHMAPARDAEAWRQLVDPQGFAAPYGPTTVERRSPWFMHDAELGCCRWSGPSWPYATSQTLTAMATLLEEYPPQPYVDEQDYVDLLHGYAATQRKGGRPYVAEAHHPDEDRWLYDGPDHSEDYNHSTFTDLVLSGLLGVRPQASPAVRISPLVPDDWDWFALENQPYHGHNLSVVWDRDGSRYGVGAGLRVYLDGDLVHRQAGLDAVRVPVTTRPGTGAALPEEVDDLANVDESGYPQAFATFSYRDDPPANAVDGQDFALDRPTTRWSSYGSPHPRDSLTVDLGAPARVADVRVSFYDDGGGVRTPDHVRLESRRLDGTWRVLPGQARSSAVPVPGVPLRVTSAGVTTSALRLTAWRDDGGAVGVTALSAWHRVDPALSVTADGADQVAEGGGPLVEVTPGLPVVVRATLTTEQTRQVRPRLLAPAGWAVEPVGGTGAPGTVRPGAGVPLRWRVTPPDDLALADDTPLRVLVAGRSGGATTGAAQLLLTARSVFRPGGAGPVVYADDFSTDRGGYRVDRPFGAEPLPETSVEGGLLVVRADQQAGVALAAPDALPDPSREVAVVLDVAGFSGSEPEDSLFVGRSDGDGDNVLGWYNHAGSASGVDVRRGGQADGDASGGCCATVELEPGDRFAAVFSDDRLTTWRGHDGAWELLRRAPYARAADPADVADWAPAIGLRLTGGALSVDRWVVRSR